MDLKRPSGLVKNDTISKWGWNRHDKRPEKPMQVLFQQSRSSALLLTTTRVNKILYREENIWDWLNRLNSENSWEYYCKVDLTTDWYRLDAVSFNVTT